MRVVLLQLAATTDSEHNRVAVRKRLERLEGSDTDLVVMPEGSMHDFGAPDHDLATDAESVDGPFVEMLSEQAQALRTTIVGHIFERRESGGLPFNTAVVIGPSGDVAATYRKMHLYDSFGFLESERLSAGPITPVAFDVSGFRVGMLTCYDLRFPELARLLIDDGVDAFVVPAAWVRGPLKEDHWVTLLRARAIENTAYVLGAAQCGPNYSGRSVIVDPMGVVVAGAAEAEADVSADITTERVADSRRRNPSLVNRRLTR